MRVMSSACLLCDAHVPTGEQYVVLLADVNGDGGVSGARDLGVLCLDRDLCATRAVTRARSLAPVRTGWQNALRDVLGGVIRDAPRCRHCGCAPCQGINTGCRPRHCVTGVAFE